MTIGIAAWGPNAGGAVLAGLQAAERVGHGAIGGFVSWVALGEALEANLWRTQTQRGGSAGLFGGAGLSALPPEWHRARCAGLMSSGPDRPEPLSQFVPARAGVGLVTGHRFPNTVLADGRVFNEAVLQAIAEGMPPQQAVASLAATWPQTDAGVIALAADGRHGMSNTDAVQLRADLGSAQLGSVEEGAVVLVIHNAIRPRASLAALVCEVAWDVMHATEVRRWITLHAGVPLQRADRTAVWVDDAGLVTRVDVSYRAAIGGEGFGLGDRVAVLGEDGRAAWLGYEPYLVVREGMVLSVDGLLEVRLPVT